MIVAGRRTASASMLVALVAMLAGSGAADATEHDNSSATITASFDDSCSGFDAHSSKDISHVEIHYADGSILKDESIDAPDYSTDGGGEIDLAIVKSGTTTQRLACENPPVSACSDGVDNDGNGRMDYPDDPGCTSSSDDEESSDNGDGFD